jgi:hypothetical protein
LCVQQPQPFRLKSEATQTKEFCGFRLQEEGWHRRGIKLRRADREVPRQNSA